MEVKSFLTSKGVWGSVIAIVASLGATFGWFQVDDAAQQEIIKNVETIVAAAGGLLALWGRISATSKIGATSTTPVKATTPDGK